MACRATCKVNRMLQSLSVKASNQITLEKQERTSRIQALIYHVVYMELYQVLFLAMTSFLSIRAILGFAETNDF